MNYFWSTSTSQQQHHHARLSLAKHWKSWERLQAAEQQLIEIARCTWTLNATNPSAPVPEVTVADTPIPASSVWKKSAAGDERSSLLSRWFCSSSSSRCEEVMKQRKEETENPTETLVMHSIQIENHQAPQNDVPLVLLHGYMNGGAYFYRNWMGLSQYFGKIHALDLLGWGLSSRPDFLQLTTTTMSHQNEEDATIRSIQSSEDFFVESLEAWRKTQNIDQMILAGHSMGGYLSVAYCERYPERVQRLILISPAGVPEETPADLERRERRYLHGSVRNQLLYAWYKHWVFAKSYTLGDLLRSLPESYGRNRFAEQYVTRRLPSITDPQEQQTLTDYLYHNNVLPGSGEYCLSKFLTPTICGRHPLVHRIPNLRIASCDFLYGESDWMDSSGGLAVEQACMERRRQQQQSSNGSNTAPQINVYQISRAGHLLMLENNVEFNHALVLAAGMGSLLDATARKTLPRKLRPVAVTNYMQPSPPSNTPEGYPEAATTQVAA